MFSACILFPPLSYRKRQEGDGTLFCLSCVQWLSNQNGVRWNLPELQQEDEDLHPASFVGGFSLHFGQILHESQIGEVQVHQHQVSQEEEEIRHVSSSEAFLRERTEAVGECWSQAGLLW